MGAQSDVPVHGPVPRGFATIRLRSVRVELTIVLTTSIIAAGGSHNLAVRNDGTVWAWGQNTCGQLGNGSVSGSNVPVRVTGY